MDDSNDARPAPSPSHQRRKSFIEMLNPRASSNSTSLSSTSPSVAVPTAPGALENGRKSMSIALGLSGSGNSQDSPFNAFARQRRASISTSSASGSPEFRNSFEDSAIIEDDDKMGPINSPPSPSLGRRLSFGAQALRDVRQSGTSPSNNAGEGFNWSEAMRDRNKRSSIGSNPFAAGHNRSKSYNTPAPEPPTEMPTQAPPTATARPPGAKIKKPDHLGERMLRGEFMMD